MQDDTLTDSRQLHLNRQLLNSNSTSSRIVLIEINSNSIQVDSDRALFDGDSDLLDAHHDDRLALIDSDLIDLEATLLRQSKAPWCLRIP